MSKYTTEVRFICERTAGMSESADYSKVNDILHASYAQIFGDFPIFDEAYREPLCTKILRHYYTREIGAETVGLWKLWLNQKMNEIMPYYNKLYETELLEFNPLYNVDYTIDRDVTGTKNDTGEHTVTTEGHLDGETTNTESNTAWNLYSDTPQGGVTGVENMTYLTNATKDTNSVNTNSVNDTDTSATETKEYSSNIRNTEDYIEKVKGKHSGDSYSKLLTEFRGTLLNIDMMVINDLVDLFMGLW